ncbi:MAG: DUF4956 domain-containing protein [Atopobiaceae bacterium]|jgi:uncharacterized membrane protein YhiD involved in acid resistance|nr:DUF4956 domain-containing protein [Atopobiaceae bacterium]MCI1345049.1 DUF4956 domain-containing protein [Atopobiaceae bacterium]MCI1497934.1 DUF4956 domain-containing protein [Atopobiaceae bacterium]MCI1539655.1 DUF4956 domain-containing protein [Atopobiaceae bacterium]
MLDLLFASTTTNEVSVLPLLACMLASLVCGAMLALAYGFKARHTSSFLAALVVLPAIVCVVIALVNGNVGAGVAVAGAFSLVRFRSAPGSGRDIAFVFLAMAVGLVAGMGYPLLAGLVTLLLCAVFVGLQTLASARGDGKARLLHITVPENLDYMGAFEEVLAKLCARSELLSVKTTNMGSLVKLAFDVTLKEGVTEKQLIDAIRVRNGNLEVSLSHHEEGIYEL